MRRILGLLAAVAGAALAAPIMAEYEFQGFTPWAAGLAVGVLVGEVIASGARWRGPVAMAVAGLLSAASIIWGEWLESGSGLQPWAQVAWGAAALAAGAAAYSVRTTRPRTSAGS
ncbi:MAG: hypothetical protein QOI47_2378 [Actinomycetota bacterium]|jgi:hypothetical protein|nr:hypothetical protein [Actinomycetota bacterium]